MPADLQPVTAGAQMVGVVDRPGRQPQHLALEIAKDRDSVGCSGNDAIHGGALSGIVDRRPHRSPSVPLMWRLRGAAASETVPPEVAAASNNRIAPLNKAEALARGGVKRGPFCEDQSPRARKSETYFGF